MHIEYDAHEGIMWIKLYTEDELQKFAELYFKLFEENLFEEDDEEDITTSLGIGDVPIITFEFPFFMHEEAIILITELENESRYNKDSEMLLLCRCVHNQIVPSSMKQ